MLVTLEGLDGSGKSTLWNGLQDEFEDAVFTREPTESWYGDAVYRSIKTDDANPISELFLFTADHADHLERVIRPELEDGNLVISDRYSDSRHAYQAATLEEELSAPLQYIQGIHEPITRKPDLTIYLDIEPEKSVKRSDQANKLEDKEYLERVQYYYDRLMELDSERFVRVDATQDPDDVLADAVSIIEDQQ